MCGYPGFSSLSDRAVAGRGRGAEARVVQRWPSGAGPRTHTAPAGVVRLIRPWWLADQKLQTRLHISGPSCGERRTRSLLSGTWESSRPPPGRTRAIQCSKEVRVPTENDVWRLLLGSFKSQASYAILLIVSDKMKACDFGTSVTARESRGSTRRSAGVPAANATPSSNFGNRPADVSRAQPVLQKRQNTSPPQFHASAFPRWLFKFRCGRRPTHPGVACPIPPEPRTRPPAHKTSLFHRFLPTSQLGLLVKVEALVHVGP